MWRSVLAVILLPSLTAAQSAAEGRPGISNETVRMIINGPPRTAVVPPSATLQAYTRHTAVRQERDEDVGIMLTISGFVTAPKSAVAGIVPLQVEFEPQDGLTIKDVHGPKVWKSGFKFQGEPVNVSAMPYVQFKIRAGRNLSLGEHVLKGKFTFQRISTDGSNVGPVEQVEVQIPLAVVEHDARVHKANFPYAPMPTWETVLLIVSIPVLIAVFIPLLLLCAVTGTCPEC